MVEEVQLTVAPILKQKYVGQSVARISEDVMKKLEVEEGDILEIKPEKKRKTPAGMDFPDKTAAIVGQNVEKDEDSGIIRLDRFTRNNIKILIEEKVIVKKADIREAEKITVLPLGVFVHDAEIGDLPFPIGQPVFEKEKITLTKVGLYEKDRGDFEFDELTFVVKDTEPEGIVLTTEKTNIEISFLEE